MCIKKFSAVLVLANLVYLTNGADLGNMYWEPGDIIKCTLARPLGYIFGIKYYMLGGDQPQHVITVFHNGAEGVVREIHQKDFNYGIDRSQCQNIGKGRLSREKSIMRARRSIGRTFTFSLIGCNCQHWTNYWANGSSGKWYNNQSLHSSASYCPV